MIRVNVEINNKSWHKRIKNPKKYFKQKLQRISKILKPLKKKDLIFTILLTNSTKMKKLNNKFRKKNKPTDVLSFPFFSANQINLEKRKNFYIGDIAISYEFIESYSKRNNFINEFDKAWVHGLLHLVGYDHIKNKDFFKMNKIEKRILDSI